jgi:phosphohistidine phosphatase
MLHLYLLRHAKAVQGGAAMSDHARPLAERGWRQSAEIGSLLVRQKPAPGIVLCSDAVRTRETFEGLGIDLPQPAYSRHLYDLMDRDYLDPIKGVPDASPILLIGHNNAVARTAGLLAASEASRAYQQMTRKYVTAGLAVIAFHAATWAEIGPGRGRLLAYETSSEDE